MIDITRAVTLMSALLAAAPASTRGLYPSPDELKPCSGRQEVSAAIGPEGGNLRLARFELRVYPGSLSEEVALTVRRTPGDPDNPGRCSTHDVYTVEPFLLESAPGRPFGAMWYWSGADDEIERLPERICPKVSWTGDPSRTECYQLGTSLFTHDWRMSSATGLPAPTGLSMGLNVNACMLSRLAARAPALPWSFTSDRLGHFRLMAPEDGGLPDRHRRRWSSADHPGSVPASGCTEIPDIGLRSVRVVSGLEGEIVEVAWEPSCHGNGDCADGTYCRRPVGRCEAMGVCKEHFPDVCRRTVDGRRSDDPRVCGCDGRTYADQCEAERAGVSIRGDGPCPEADAESDARDEPTR